MPGNSLQRGVVHGLQAGRLLRSAAVDTYRATVARAAELAGGVQALGLRLQVPVVELMRWIKGEARPSRGMFLRLVDFVLEESRKPVFPLPRAERKSGKPGKPAK